MRYCSISDRVFYLIIIFVIFITNCIPAVYLLVNYSAYDTGNTKLVRAYWVMCILTLIAVIFHTYTLHKKQYQWIHTYDGDCYGAISKTAQVFGSVIFVARHFTGWYFMVHETRSFIGYLTIIELVIIELMAEFITIQCTGDEFYEPTRLDEMSPLSKLLFAIFTHFMFLSIASITCTAIYGMHQLPLEIIRSSWISHSYIVYIFCSILFTYYFLGEVLYYWSNQKLLPLFNPIYRGYASVCIVLIYIIIFIVMNVAIWEHMHAAECGIYDDYLEACVATYLMVLFPYFLIALIVVFFMFVGLYLLLKFICCISWHDEQDLAVIQLYQETEISQKLVQSNHIPSDENQSMASASASSDSVLIDIKNKIIDGTCSICFEQNLTPITLHPCKHSNICSKCVYLKNSKLRIQLCPICRAKIESASPEGSYSVIFSYK
jgi:hypothetical protein